jgi:hypothetical protein
MRHWRTLCVMITVIETKAYISRADDIMSADERSAVVDFIADNPESGDVMPGTGGVRKLRVALDGRGKRGGARVIYYYQNQEIPVFLLGLFAKNQKTSLTKAERNTLKIAITAMVAAY